MFTNLYLTPAEAKRIFVEYGRKPLKEGEFGAVTGETFESHFAEYSQTYIDVLGASLEKHRNYDWHGMYQKGTFVLKFDRYLPHMPDPLLAIEIILVRAEIVRLNNEKTRALPGYYEDEKTGLVAVVENIVPINDDMHGRRRTAMVAAQNIRVSGPNLAAVQKFNTNVGSGFANRFLVNRFN